MSDKHVTPIGGPGAGHEPHDTAQEIRVYLTIFGALGLLTLATVGVAYMELPNSASIVVALLIAFAKVFLIAAFFMHLLHEGRLINWSLAVCVFALLILILFVIPDLGIHPVEEAGRVSMAEAEKVFHEVVGGGEHGAHDAAAPASH
jgi:caa(3)-type oxidase subunit IV